MSSATFRAWVAIVQRVGGEGLDDPIKDRRGVVDESLDHLTLLIGPSLFQYAPEPVDFVHVFNLAIQWPSYSASRTKRAL